MQNTSNTDHKTKKAAPSVAAFFIGMPAQNQALLQ